MTAAARKTTALPLALAYAVLIVYASLYPFDHWRDQGIAPWAFLSASWPKYWTGFDLGINVAGYVPFGFLVATAVLRGGVATRVWRATGRAFIAGLLLSMAMETLQSYLPSRIPSNVDLALNAAGALLGALIAGALVRLGILDRWSRLREAWFIDDARGALVMLALWPAALLFPAAVPFGLGQVFERMEAAVADWLYDTPFLDWLPMREFELEPLVPAAEMLCAMLGLLVPCLLAFAITRSRPGRLLMLAIVMLAGVGASALSAALSYGPDHAWAWLSLPVRVGIGLAVLLALGLVAARGRLTLGLMLLALGLHLSLLNQAPESAYFAQTLATWEQGRFIRFNGLAQWLGWLWPFAAMGYSLFALSRRGRS